MKKKAITKKPITFNEQLLDSSIKITCNNSTCGVKNVLLTLVSFYRLKHIFIQKR